MSTTTDKLALFKYDPSTDGAQTFNIQKALNENWDKLDDAVKEILITLANKAPNGYGLGQIAYGPTFDGKPYNADGITGSGFFMCKNGTPTADWGAILHIQFDNKKRAIQCFDAAFEWSGITDITKGTLFKREKFESTWGPWEYINPPMAVGVEYRTTELYLGKPVYTKVVDFGASPNNGIKNVDLGVPDVEKICGASFCYYVPSTGENGVMVSHTQYTGFLVSNRVVQIRTNADKTDINFYVTVKYTKTTD